MQGLAPKNKDDTQLSSPFTLLKMGENVFHLCVKAQPWQMYHMGNDISSALERLKWTVKFSSGEL